MMSYDFNIESLDLLKEELRKYFSENKFKTKEPSEKILYFEKGNAWALIPAGFINIGRFRGFLVMGDIRIQEINKRISCNITFNRNRLWMINLIWSLFYLVSIITFSAKNIYPNVRTGLLAGLLVIAFFQIWIVNASERRFLKLFEKHFEKFL